jgi:RHS repeat-associated protein
VPSHLAHRRRHLLDVVRARYDYDVWGNRTQLSGDLDCEIGFTGYWNHVPSGLYLSPTRAYSSAFGRFITRDPIEEQGGINLYRYVGNDPVNRIDPKGQDPREVAIGLAILAAAFTAPEIANAPGPGDRIYPSQGPALFILDTALGTAVGKCIADVIPPLIGKLPLLLGRGGTEGTENIVEVLGHGLRHIADVDQAAVIQAIQENIAAEGAPGIGETIQRTIVINGRQFSFRAFGLPGGKTSVGTVVPGSFTRNVAEP